MVYATTGRIAMLKSSSILFIKTPYEELAILVPDKMIPVGLERVYNDVKVVYGPRVIRPAHTFYVPLTN